VRSVDLAPALDAAAAALAGALTTAGSRATFRAAGTATINADTTAATTTPGAVVSWDGQPAVDVPVIVVPDAPGGVVQVYPGAAGAEDPRWRVIAPPGLTGIGRGVTVEVTASRDARQIGRVWEITTMLDNAAGAARIALARAVPERGQA
jgi:hypothetical protein